MLSRTARIIGGVSTRAVATEKELGLIRRAPPARSVLTSRIENELELLQRHVMMLKTIIANEPIGIIRLSELSKFPQHKVRYSLRILEQEGLIEPSPGGAVTTEKLNGFLPVLKEILSNVQKTVEDIRAKLEE